MPTLHVTATEDVIRIPGYYSDAQDRVAVFEATGSRAKALAVFDGGSHSMFTDRRGTGGAALNPQVKEATRALSVAFLQRVFDARSMRFVNGRASSPASSRVSPAPGCNLARVTARDMTLEQHRALVAALRHGLGPDCELIETHISTLLLAGEFAYKLRKPLALGFKEGLAGDARNYYLSILEAKPNDQEARKALNNLDTPLTPSQPRDIPKTAPPVQFPTPEHYSPPKEIKAYDDKSDLFPSSVIEPQIMPKAAEAPPPDKDSEMHYHLGIAYKEMELFDYAISEFEMASSSPGIKFDCYIMLGNSF